MNINKLLKIGRASDWWEYKIPPLLAIAYATIIQNEVSFITMVPGLLFLLVALGFGAVYAYTINDLTDMEEDRAAGKSNQMAKINPRFRWIIPFIFFLGGFSMFCVFIYKGDYLSGFIYGLPCVCFSLYSFRPFRLKERGIWGILADALGAHFFLSLLMVSSLSFLAKQPIDWVWFSLVGLWSLIFGLRGILWHQFHDRDNDKTAGTNTFATSIKPEKFKKNEIFLFLMELLPLLGILFKLNITVLFFLLLGYTLLATCRYRFMGYKLVIVTSPKNLPIQILMLDFYLVFLPVGLLLHGVSIDPSVWIILGAHIILFHRKLINILLDLALITRSRIVKAVKISKHS